MQPDFVCFASVDAILFFCPILSCLKPYPEIELLTIYNSKLLMHSLREVALDKCGSGLFDSILYGGKQQKPSVFCVFVKKTASSVHLVSEARGLFPMPH